MMHSHSLRELQSICTDFFLGNLYLQKTRSFILFGGIDRCLESRNREVQLYISYNFVCSKGLNSIIVKEK